jgi:FkbM family methyltransferase
MSAGDTSLLSQVTGVIHVGANTGQERELYGRFGLRVVWVEPIAEIFEELKKNIVEYPLQEAFCALITDEDGVDYTFNISNNGGASSSIFELHEHQDIWAEVKYVECRVLRSVTLASLFKRERLDPTMYSALIMDVQGAELLVLRGANELLEHIRFIKAEAADFESYAGCAMLEELDDYIKSRGFVEINRCSFATRPEGGTYWDVIWGRK